MPSREDEFFIGWLTMPAVYRRAVRRASIVGISFAALLALLVSAEQQLPGRGQWNDDQEVSLEGMAYCRPYAMLRTIDMESDKVVRTFLLVDSGKFGAVERLSPFDGQPVAVRGTILHRDGRWMLELADGDAAIQRLAKLNLDHPETLEWPHQSHPHRLAVQGEIIDPKCFLGGMKPGNGKTHKACATLCISGGIPPMLFTRGADGEPIYFLLVAGDGAAINDKVLTYVGDIVELVGDVVDLDGFLVLRIDPEAIKRL